VRLGDVLREDSATQTVRRIVRPGHRLFFPLEARDDDKRPEDLFAVDLHVILHVRKDGRGDEEALAVDVLVRLSARGQGGALGLAGLDVAEHFLVLRLGDLRALEGFVVERVADLADGLDLLLELVAELVVDGVLDQDARGGGADLAHVRHDADVAPLDGLVEVGVFEDEQRRLAARLQRDVLHVHGGHLHDLPAGRGAAGEGDLVDIEMRGDGRAAVFAVAVQHVHHARREAGFFDQGGEIEDRERSLLGGFDDDRVAARQRRPKLPRRHRERVIPGDDLPAHAEWLTKRVRELGGRGVDDLAVDFVCVAAVVLQYAGDLCNVFVQGDLVWLACRDRSHQSPDYGSRNQSNWGTDRCPMSRSLLVSPRAVRRVRRASSSGCPDLLTPYLAMMGP